MESLFIVFDEPTAHYIPGRTATINLFQNFDDLQIGISSRHPGRVHQKSPALARTILLDICRTSATPNTRHTGSKEKCRPSETKAKDKPNRRLMPPVLGCKTLSSRSRKMPCRPDGNRNSSRWATTAIVAPDTRRTGLQTTPPQARLCRKPLWALHQKRNIAVKCRPLLDQGRRSCPYNGLALWRDAG